MSQPHYRISEGAASEASEGPLSSHASLSTAAERVQMKVQLQSIRQTLNTITTAVGHPSGPQSQPVKHSSAVSMSGAPLDPVEKLLMQISQQLSDVAGQVARVERREHKLSSSVHELQKISAGAINETARLVDLMGPSTSPGVAGPGFMSPPPRSRTRTGLPASSGALTSSMGAGTGSSLDQVVGTIHHHAYHLHKLAAGLDHLEQHMLRQDQTVDSVQKQLAAVLREGGTSLPSDLVLKLHDTSDLLNKLKSHVYKLDKKVSASELHGQQAHNQLDLLAARVDALEQCVQGALTQQGTAMNNALSSPSQRTNGPTVAMTAADTLQPALAAAVAAAVAAQMEPLQAEVGAVKRQVQGLQDAVADKTAQVEQLQQELQDRDSRVAAATQAAQESKQQLAAVMAAQSAAAEAARAHEAQLNQLRAELQIALDALEANAQANGVRMASRSTSMSLPPGVVTAGLDLPGLVQQLQSGLDHVSVRVSQLSVELGGRCGAVEETVRELKTAREASEATAASLAEQLAAVTAAVEQQGVAHAELLGRFTEADKDRESLQGQLGELVQVVAEQVEGARATLEVRIDDLHTRVTAEGQAAAAETAQLQTSVRDLQQATLSLTEQVAEVVSRADKATINLQRAVNGLSQDMKAVQSDMSSIQGSVRSELGDRLGQLATKVEALNSQMAQSQSELSGLREVVLGVDRAASEAVARLGDMATRVQAEGLAAALEELQSSCSDTKAALDTLCHLVATEYVSHDKLSAIFAAREDMRAALTKLEHVFHAGTVSSQGSHEVADVDGAQPAATAYSIAQGIVSEEVSKQVQDLRSQVVQLQQELRTMTEDVGLGQQSVDELGRQMNELANKVAHVLRRMDGMVQQEQLARMQASLMGMELQLRQGGMPGQPAAAPQAQQGAVWEEVFSRLASVERQVSDVRDFYGEVEVVISGDVPRLMQSVQDLQLMLFDLRGSTAHLSGGALPADLGTPTRNSSAGGMAAAREPAGPTRFGPQDSEPGIAATAGPVVYHTFAAPGGGVHLESAEPTAAVQQHQQISDRLTELEMAVESRLARLEDALRSLTVTASTGHTATDTPVTLSLQVADPPCGDTNTGTDQAVADEASQLTKSDAAVYDLAARLSGVERRVTKQETDLMALNDWGAVVGLLRVQLQNLVEDQNTVRADCAKARAAASESAAAALQAASSAAAAQRSAAAAGDANVTSPVPLSSNSLTLPPSNLPPVRVAPAQHDQDTAAAEAAPQLLTASSTTLPPRLSLPTAATTDGNPHDRSARSTLSGLPPVSPTMSIGAGNSQARCLQKLLEVVRKQSTRLHMQYADERGVEGELNQVDNTLAHVQRELEAFQGSITGDAYAEAMVAILDQVAALRTIGSQTHPAIQQMLLTHESQMQLLNTRVDALEAVVKRFTDSHAALSKVVHSRLSGGPNPGLEAPSTPDGLESGLVRPVVACAAGALTGTQLSSTGMSDRASGDGSDSAVDAMAMGALEQRLVEYGKVLQSMRHRIVALQEYLDSTQGMVKELHTVHGSVLLRVGALEEAALSSSNGQSYQAGGDVGQVQADLAALEARLRLTESSQSQQLTSALDELRRVEDRLRQLDSRVDSEVASKLNSLSQTMPALAGELKSLELTLQARLDVCCRQLSAMGGVMADMALMEKPESKNPFHGLAVGGNAPAVKLLDGKVELMRSSLAKVSKALTEEFKKPLV